MGTFKVSDALFAAFAAVVVCVHDRLIRGGVTLLNDSSYISVQVLVFREGGMCRFFNFINVVFNGGAKGIIVILKPHKKRQRSDLSGRFFHKKI